MISITKILYLDTIWWTLIFRFSVAKKSGGLNYGEICRNPPHFDRHNKVLDTAVYCAFSTLVYSKSLIDFFARFVDDIVTMVWVGSEEEYIVDLSETDVIMMELGTIYFVFNSTT